MPKGPRGEIRPSDPVAQAVMIGRIATGEIEDIKTKKTARARSGRARAESLTPEERSNIAVAAAAARWNDE